ncbi:redox-regulated ATPase YchF [Candidatus Bipolaricaulota bacterium]|nr:redox-regulated ATPase YchF [Candidatus Bipolaricaulota bacterium]
MSLRCGLIGRPQCGKTTVFNAVTAAHASMFDAAEAHRATVAIPDQRVQKLVDLYSPAKISPSTMDVVDIPGLEEGATTEGGRGSKLLTHIKEADVLIHVVRCFENGHGSVDAIHDAELVDLELMAADSQTLTRKLERISKRARTGDKFAIQETENCQRVLDRLHDGIPARRQGLTDAERASVFECTLMSLKPVLYVANVAGPEDMNSDAVKALRTYGADEGSEMVSICGRDEADISELPEEDRAEFLSELGLHELSVERLIHAAYSELGLVDFFTAGDTEVHVWTCCRGSKAPIAAGKIHTDMESGFIRMEVIAYDDLIEHGSEEAVAKAGKLRLEGKEYEIRDGDIVVIRFSPSR